MSAPVVIIGAGLAGLSAALALAPRPVLVLGRPLAHGTTSSSLAQGGIAAAVGEDDAPVLHAQDTLKAGAGRCDPAAVKVITSLGPKAIARLESWGVVFDRDKEGHLICGREGAHGRRRVVHAGGDSTGARVMQALIERARATPSISFLEDACVTRLIADSHEAAAGLVFRRAGAFHFLPARQIVLATGSACALWQAATVPAGSWGSGLSLAAGLGARLSDLAFVQFHPTALDVGLDPMPLVSEAVRGEGAFLINERGERFVDELSPRDVVARAIFAQREAGGRVFLDARGIDRFAARFPTVASLCLEAGVDPAHAPIPVRPAAHYHMGGIATDLEGRTNVEGLWACGEGACTGLHGANRLASNSLLEAVVMGCRVGEAMPAFEAAPATLEPWLGAQDPADTSATILQVRALMETYVGVRREAEGLERAVDRLTSLAAFSPRARIGALIAQAALDLEESCGAHFRADFPSLSSDVCDEPFLSARPDDRTLGARRFA